MSIASDQKLREVAASLEQAIKMIAALKLRLDALEAMVVPRHKLKLPDRKTTWAHPTTP